MPYGGMSTVFLRFFKPAGKIKDECKWTILETLAIYGFLGGDIRNPGQKKKQAPRYLHVKKRQFYAPSIYRTERKPTFPLFMSITNLSPKGKLFVLSHRDR